MNNKITAWVVYNVLTKKYHAYGLNDYRSVDALLDAHLFVVVKDAFELRDELCLRDLVAQDYRAEESGGDFSHWDPWLPPGWDFEKDGEVTGKQLSGPWVVQKMIKKVTLSTPKTCRRPRG